MLRFTKLVIFFKCMYTQTLAMILADYANFIYRFKNYERIFKVKKVETITFLAAFDRLTNVFTI